MQHVLSSTSLYHRFGYAVDVISFDYIVQLIFPSVIGKPVTLVQESLSTEFNEYVFESWIS